MQDHTSELIELLGSTTFVVPASVGSARALVLQEALPRDPFEALYIARVPEPKPLVSEQTPAQRALLLVRAYLGALRASKLKPTMWAAYLRNGCPDITTSKAYASLVSLADVFVSTSIAPASWSAFRLDVLKHAHATDVAAGNTSAVFKPPSLPVLMSATWLREPKRRGWYRRDYTSRGWSSRVVKTPAYTQLMRAWAALQTDLDACSALTVDSAKAIFSSRFPDGSLSTLVERANTEARTAQATYDARAADGEWLW